MTNFTEEYLLWHWFGKVSFLRLQTIVLSEILRLSSGNWLKLYEEKLCYFNAIADFVNLVL